MLKVDVLPSKNQVLWKLNYCQFTAIQLYLMTLCQQRLITKETALYHKAIQILLNGFILQYFSDKYLFKVHKAEILTVTL